MLIVEDDAIQRDSVCRLLGSNVVEIIAAASVQEAIAQLQTSTFDCIVTDLMLPDASGFELIEQSLLRRYSSSIIVKDARSQERLLDEVMLFLHQVETELPPERQRLLQQARDRETVFKDRLILVVEDDVRNVFALSRLLESKGARLLTARNGYEALAAPEQHEDVDLVLMDIMMPEMDDFQATREIRQQPRWAKLPIIALTAKAMKDDQARCLKAGANDYVSKPLDVEILFSLLRVWMPKSPRKAGKKRVLS